MSYTYATQTDFVLPELVIRRATAEDAPALARLAALDSARVPRGDVLVAFAHGEPWAAISLDDGRVVADPFRPSAVAAELVRVRAQHLAGPRERRAPVFAALRLRRASA